MEKEITTEKKTDKPKKKKREKPRTKGNTDYSRGYWIVLIAIVVSITLIVISNTMLIFFSIFSTDTGSASNSSLPETQATDVSVKVISSNSKNVTNTVGMSQSEKVESTLLASGVSIIGIAIAVWAGLNILKALETNQYKKLKEEIDKIEDERKTFNHNTILNSVSQLEDELNQYLYMQMRDLTIEYVDAKTFSKLNSIEIRFQQLYRKHYNHSNIKIEDYTKDIKNIETQLSTIDKLSPSVQEIVKIYLNVRCAETHFYLGYDEKNYRNNVEQMNLAIEFYLKSFPEMKNPDSIDIKSDWFESNIKLNTYLLNTIGEAYSEIINNDNQNNKNEENEKILSDKEHEEFSNKARYYFNTMKAALDEYKNSKIHRELYYRDYGCAMERIKGISNATINDIANAYKKAIDIVIGQNAGSQYNYKPFKVYLSLFHKYCDKLFQVKLKKEEKCKYNILPDADELKHRFDKNNIKQYKEQISKTKAYLDIAIAKFPDSMEFLKYKAFYYRDIALFEYLDDNTSEFEENRNLMNQVLEQLKNLIDENDYDPFMLSIKHQYEQMCDYSKIRCNTGKN